MEDVKAPKPILKNPTKVMETKPEAQQESLQKSVKFGSEIEEKKSKPVQPAKKSEPEEEQPKKTSLFKQRMLGNKE